MPPPQPSSTLQSKRFWKFSITDWRLLSLHTKQSSVEYFRSSRRPLSVCVSVCFSRMFSFTRPAGCSSAIGCSLSRLWGNVGHAQRHQPRKLREGVWSSTRRTKTLLSGRIQIAFSNCFPSSDVLLLIWSHSTKAILQWKIMVSFDSENYRLTFSFASPPCMRSMRSRHARLCWLGHRAVWEWRGRRT